MRSPAANELKPVAICHDIMVTFEVISAPKVRLTQQNSWLNSYLYFVVNYFGTKHYYSREYRNDRVKRYTILLYWNTFLAWSIHIVRTLKSSTKKPTSPFTFWFHLTTETQNASVMTYQHLQLPCSCIFLIYEIYCLVKTHFSKPCVRI